MTDENERPVRFLRFAEVLSRVSLSRSEIYRRINLNTFPKSVRLSEARVAWIETDIEIWQRLIMGKPVAVPDTKPTVVQPIAVPDTKPIVVKPSGVGVRLIRITEVKDRVGLSVPEIYRRMRLGWFPRPVALTQTRVAWEEAKINDWIAQKLEEGPLQSAANDPKYRMQRTEIVPPIRTGGPVMNTATASKTRKAVKPVNANSEMNWGQQNARGRTLAAETMDKILRSGFTPSLGFKVTELTENEPGGVLVGFLQEISERAMRGSYVQ